MSEALYVCTVIFVAGLVQGFTGFGSVLLALPLMVLFLDVKTAVPFMTLAGMTLNLLLVIPLWKHLDWKKIWPLLAGSLFGIPISIYLLIYLESRAIMIIIGLTLLAYGLYGLFIRTKPYHLKGSWGYFFGFLSGCLAGFGTASPPAVVYTSMQPWNKDEVKSTLQGYFILSNIAVIAGQGGSGLITKEALHYYYLSILPIMAGTYLGHFFYEKVPEIVYRRGVLIMLALLGAFTVWRQTV